MQKQLKKAFGILLVISILLTAFPLTASAAPVRTDAGVGDDPSFTTMSVSSAESLKAYLEMDGDYQINIIADLSYRIGKKGDIANACPEYWCKLGSGVKVVDMQGYDFSLYCDSKDTQSRNGSAMFKITSGAEFVLNDTVGNGTLNYNAMLKEGYDNRDVRDIFKVSGGKLTVNGGRVIAGRRSDKHIIDLGYAYLQVNGHGIVMHNGETVINGGRIEGRGEIHLKNCAAVKANGGSLTVNDGDVVGYGNADALSVDNSAAVTVRSGYFDVYKNDEEVYTEPNTVSAPKYGNIGIPGRAFSHDSNLSRTKVWRKGRGELSALDVRGGAVLEISDRVLVEPKNVTATAQYSFDGATWNDITASTVINWDKQSNLKFRCFDSPFFTQRRIYDKVSHYYPAHRGSISLSPGGEALSDGLSDMRNSRDNDAFNGYTATEAQAALDLYDYKNQAAVLENGKTYYLQLSATEYYKGTHTYRRTVSPANNIQIKITQPTAVPTLNVDFDWSLDDNGNLVVMPKGDATRTYLDNLRVQGVIGSYKARITYLNKSNTNTTYNYGDNFIGRWGHNDIRRGVSTLKLIVDIYRGSVLQKTFTKSASVVYPPDMTADKTADSNNAIYFYPSSSDRSVTFTATGGSASSVFWVKNGTKITGATGATYRVDDAASASGWYSLGYTYSGTDYYGVQEFYVGMKNGTRSVTVSKSSSSCTITSPSSTTPTFTVNTTGTGWGTISKYRWEIVDVPEGLTGYTRYRTLSTKTATLSEIFSRTDATFFLQGSYTLQCRVTDTLGNQQTGSPVTVTVSRPATDLTVSCGGEDVTGKFIAFSSTSDTAALETTMLPVNAVSSNTTFFSSSDTSVCSVTSSGVIQAKSPGTATVTIVNGSINKTVTVYVPKTQFTLTIPQSYLNAVPGEIAYQGAITVPGGSGFTAELTWSVANGNYYSEMPDGAAFEGETCYCPQVIIYPDSGVAYPSVKEQNRELWNIEYGNIDITINGATYYGKANGYYSYMTSAPLSRGDRSCDYIYLFLDPTEKLIDPRDEYLNLVEFEVEIPLAGQSAMKLENGNVAQLAASVLTDGIAFGGDSLVEITDTSTIKDNSLSNDATTAFPEGGVFEAGKTYRYGVWLLKDRDYRTPDGGVVRFEESTSAYCLGMRTLTTATYAESGMLVGYIYFTVEEPEFTLGDVNSDGRINIKDVTAIQRALADYEQLTIAQMRAADVNGDGFVTIEDATRLQQYLALFFDEL